MIEEEVKKLIEKDVNDLGIIIDNIEYVKEGGNNFLRITIDRQEAIDIDKCVEVTNVINPILDKTNIIKDGYILDVTTKEKGENNG